ncbi:MAG TPA: TadE/TadG family type IV pilus assembly protein [Terracidiphilus sp.]|jgi:Flp pilus assembly protein TadG
MKHWAKGFERSETRSGKSLKSLFSFGINSSVIGRFIHRTGVAGESGGSLVEFAISLPMAMVLLTGMFSFGIAINNFMVLTSAVGSGARALALTRGQTTPALAASDPCAYAVQVANQSAPGLNTSGITYTITWTTQAGTATTYNTPSCAGAAFSANDTVLLKATYPVNITLYAWTPKSLKIGAVTSELVQ